MLPRQSQVLSRVGLALGSVSLGNTWRAAVKVWGFSTVVTDVTDPLCIGLGILALVWFGCDVCAEKFHGRSMLFGRDLLDVHFWAAVGVGGCIVSSASASVAVWSTDASTAIWYAGVSVQLAILAAASIAGLVEVVMRCRDGRQVLGLADATPLLYPFTVAIGIPAMTYRAAVVPPPDHGGGGRVEDLVRGCFWMAFLFSVVLAFPTVALFRRQLKTSASAQTALPAAFLQLAPFPICLVAWTKLNVNGSTVREGAMMLTLLVGMFASVVVVLMFTPHLARMKFTSMWATLTFPTVSMANGLVVYRSLHGHSDSTLLAFDVLCGIGLATATMVVVVVWILSTLQKLGISPSRGSSLPLPSITSEATTAGQTTRPAELPAKNLYESEV